MRWPRSPRTSFPPQVDAAVEPIYNRSAGRWVNFRKYMEPVLPILRPWIEKFGYEA